MFYSEDVATRWFEQTLWPEQRCCGHCGSIATSEVPNRKPMPYRCRDCRKYFSVRTGTPIAKTNLPLRKWAVAIYLELTSLKSISSMKLSRDIGVSQPAAWFMLHRIREGWSGLSGNPPFSGPVEVDETYMGGKRRNMSTEKREALTGRGPVGKVAVAGIKDRTTNKVRPQSSPTPRAKRCAASLWSTPTDPTPRFTPTTLSPTTSFRTTKQLSTQLVSTSGARLTPMGWSRFGAC